MWTAKKNICLSKCKHFFTQGSESSKFGNPFSKQLLCYLQYWLHNPWVSTHAQVVIATPNGHLPLILQRGCKVISHGELVGQAIHCFEHTVSVVALLFHDLLLKKVIIIEAGHCDRGRTQRLLNLMDEAMSQLMKFSTKTRLKQPTAVKAGTLILCQHFSTQSGCQSAQIKLTAVREVVLQQMGDPFRSLIKESLHQISFPICTSPHGAGQGWLLQLCRGHF